MAMKIKKSDDVVLTFFGDGTSSQGDFHVGLNFASATKHVGSVQWIEYLHSNGLVEAEIGGVRVFPDGCSAGEYHREKRSSCPSR